MNVVTLYRVRFGVIGVVLTAFVFNVNSSFDVFVVSNLLRRCGGKHGILGIRGATVFFSTFATLINVNMLIFTRRPTLGSVTLVSMLNLDIIIYISCAVRPVLFELLIDARAEHNMFPCAVYNVLGAVCYFICFLLNYILVRLCTLMLALVPVGHGAGGISFRGLLC